MTPLLLLQQEYNVSTAKTVFFDSFIDVDFSISWVGIHGHLFACCLTVKKRLGLRCGMSAYNIIGTLLVNITMYIVNKSL